LSSLVSALPRCEPGLDRFAAPPDDAFDFERGWENEQLAPTPNGALANAKQGCDVTRSQKRRGAHAAGTRGPRRPERGLGELPLKIAELPMRGGELLT
jgi:hypothetical protein